MPLHGVLGLRFESSGTGGSSAPGCQVISSQPGLSGEPLMIHLLPGGAVPQVHGARSPVPPRLPHFARPRSVPHLATMAAGAYPPRRPPDAWLPGLLAPPGPCYWLVASGIPMGWRGGCLAAGWMRSTVCYYSLGGCSALVVCARLSRQVWRVGTGAGFRFSPWASPFPRVPCCACCGWSCLGVHSLRLPVCHSMGSVRSASLVWLPFGSEPRVRWVWVRSRSRGVHASPPNPGRCGARYAPP